MCTIQTSTRICLKKNYQNTSILKPPLHQSEATLCPTLFWYRRTTYHKNNPIRKGVKTQILDRKIENTPCWRWCRTVSGSGEIRVLLLFRKRRRRQVFWTDAFVNRIRYVISRETRCPDLVVIVTEALGLCPSADGRTNDTNEIEIPKRRFPLAPTRSTNTTTRRRKTGYDAFFTGPEGNGRSYGIKRSEGRGEFEGKKFEKRNTTNKIVVPGAKNYWRV